MRTYTLVALLASALAAFATPLPPSTGDRNAQVLAPDIQPMQEHPLLHHPVFPKWMERTFGLTRFIVPVQAFGTSKIPKCGKILFVGNHQNYGIDALFILRDIHKITRVFPHSLADRIHHKIPILKQILNYFGCVPGTPQNCRAIMRTGKPILIFPGGHKETTKRAGTPKYQLEWQNRFGFAKMAMEHGYQIVPFAMIGMEDVFETWFHIPVTPILRFFGDNRKDFVIPVAKPWRIQPQKHYIEFGDAIDATSFGHDTTDIPQVTALHDEALGSVRKSLEKLLLWQSRDPNRYPFGKVKNYMKGCIKRLVDEFILGDGWTAAVRNFNVAKESVEEESIEEESIWVN